VRVISPFHFTPRDVRAARDLLLGQSGPDSPFRLLLTDHAPLADLPAVFARLRSSGGIKTVIRP
jgi:hypothetical protein